MTKYKVPNEMLNVFVQATAVCNLGMAEHDRLARNGLKAVIQWLDSTGCLDSARRPDFIEPEHKGQSLTVLPGQSFKVDDPRFLYAISIENRGTDIIHVIDLGNTLLIHSVPAPVPTPQPKDDFERDCADLIDNDGPVEVSSEGYNNALREAYERGKAGKP